LSVLFFKHDEEWRGRGDRAQILDPAAFEQVCLGVFVFVLFCFVLLCFIFLLTKAAVDRQQMLVAERAANIAKVVQRRHAHGMDAESYKMLKKQKIAKRRVQAPFPL
jgi:hypothetical protein